MKLVACSVYNKAYERVEGVYVAPSVGLMIRDNSKFLARVSPNFIEDLELREIGSFSDDGTIFNALPEPVIHSWDEYKNPEVIAKPLTEEEKQI